MKNSRVILPCCLCQEVFFSLFPYFLICHRSFHPFLPPSQRSLSSSSSAPQSSLSRSLPLSIYLLLFSPPLTPPLPPPLFLQLSRRGYLGLRIHKTRLRCVCFCYFSQNGAPTATLLAADPRSAATGRRRGVAEVEEGGGGGGEASRGFGGGPPSRPAAAT